MSQLSEQIDRKYVDVVTLDDEWEIMTDTGWESLTDIKKTVLYQVYKITLANQYTLEAADDHILFDELFNEVFLKDLNIGDKIQTDSGPVSVIAIEVTNSYEHMFDTSVNSYNHRFYTNKILSHNSTIASAYLLWFAMFNDDSTILITSNKYEGAQEIMTRVRFTYESVPDHIKAGVKVYNKRSLEFDNGSRIVSTTTTENTGRGMSLSLVYCDEFAFVDDTIARAFWTSISPTLSTGGKCIITSTPNTDEDQFADIWFGSQPTLDEFGNDTDLGRNGFKSFKATWIDHPERNQDWADAEIASIGESRFNREHNCVSASTKITLCDKNNVISEISISELYDIYRNSTSPVDTNTVKDFYRNIHDYKVLTADGFKSFAGISLMKFDKVWRITLENSQWLECSDNHKIFTSNNERKELKDISINEEIFTQYGYKRIISIKDMWKIEPLFDLVEVEDGRRYYTNGILSSNCEFITYEETLINPIKMGQIQTIMPVRKSGQVRWFEEIKSDAIYIVALDPSMGTGGDNSAIQVIELPSLKQVAEWSSNKSPVENQIKILRDILLELYNAGKPELYWSVESNTLGEAALVVIRDTGEDNFPGSMLHDPKNRLNTKSARRAGFVTTHKSKLEACARLKHLIESNKFKINSRLLLSELKTFVARGNTYEAKIGQTDDLIMALLLAVRMIDHISSWDVESHDAISCDVSSDDENDYTLPLPVFI